MTGPEQLQVGGPGPRRRVLVAVLVGLLVVALGVVIGLRLPRPSVSEPALTRQPVAAHSTSVTAPSRAWPGGIPSGTLYVVASGRVVSVDASTGTLKATGISSEPGEVSVTPYSAGALVWSHDGDHQAYDEFAAPPGGFMPPEAAGPYNTFLPGPDLGVWAASVSPTRPAGTTTWHLIDDEGRSRARVEIPGETVPDGAGGLIGVTDAGFRRLAPRRGPLERSTLVAVGAAGVLSHTCLRHACSTTLVAAHDARTDVPVSLPDDVELGLLSPRNRFAAVAGTRDDDTTLDVSALTSARVQRSFGIDGPDVDRAAWLSDRWLVLISDDQLVLFDAVADTVSRPDVGLVGLEGVTWVPA